jgi:hypothetical protein
MKVNMKVMVEILLPSSLTYGRTWTLNMCFTNRLITCKVMTLLNVSIVSKKSNSYMTKLPFVIQEMHDKNKSANTSPWQLKI